jgi:hypothetical protein
MYTLTRGKIWLTILIARTEMCSRHPYLKSRVLRWFVTGCFTYHENKTLWYCSIRWKEFQESRHNIQSHLLSKISYAFTKHDNVFLFGYVTVLVRTATVRIEQNENNTKNGSKRYIIQRPCINFTGTIRLSLKRFSMLRNSKRLLSCLRQNIYKRNMVYPTDETVNLLTSNDYIHTCASQ